MNNRSLAPVLRRNAAVLVAAVAVLALGLTVMVTTKHQQEARADSDPTVVRGVVTDATGKPVSGATISLGSESTRSNDNGAFDMEVAGPGLATAEKDGYLPRTLMLEPGHSRTVELSSQRDDTLSLRFGGDVMAGRRYYEKTPDHGPLLTKSSGAEDHAALLAGVKPLLEDADLSTVNLETPLVEKPYFDPTKRRPARFRQDKTIALATDVSFAEAMRRTGIDVVSLGNNHVMDAFEEGLKSTQDALDEAGIIHFGAGKNQHDALQPAYVERRGQTVAYIGCTTVDGRQHKIPYVATATKPGAAACNPKQLRKVIEKADERADTVVFMPHGDVEYRRQQVSTIRSLADLARESGADIVAASHPHVIGGLSTDDDYLFIETMGNLLFDQTLWQTYPSYIARADVRDGELVTATADPVVLEDYRPHAAAGLYADAVSRIATGTASGSARLSGPGSSVRYLQDEDEGGEKTQRLEAGKPEHLAPGWWADPNSASGLRFGKDLLFGTGSFEQLAPSDWTSQVGIQSATGNTAKGMPTSRLWMLGKYAELTHDGACRASWPESTTGLQVSRSPLSKKDVIAANSNRIPVGDQVSLLADVRRAEPGSSLEIHWYASTRGGSMDVSTIDLPNGSWSPSECESVRLDVERPVGASYAQVFLRQKPPGGGQRVLRTAVDNVRLVEWASHPFSGRAYDTVEANSDAEITVHKDDPAAGSKPFLR